MLYQLSYERKRWRLTRKRHLASPEFVSNAEYLRTLRTKPAINYFAKGKLLSTFLIAARSVVGATPMDII